MISEFHRRSRLRWLAAGFALTSFVTGAGAASITATGPAALGEAVQRDYLFETAPPKRISYALFVPSTYDAAKPAPLVVLLHGWGSNPWQVIHYQGILQEAEKRGFIVVAPYGYNEVGGYGSRGPDKNGSWLWRSTAVQPPNLGELSEKDVLNVLALVKKEYSADPKRVYLMGHSMGGGGTLYLGMKYKERWAALAALSPALYGSPAALAGMHEMPVMMVQGDMDRLVKVENTRRWVDTMKELKMEYRYIEIKGGDHIFSICANPAMIAEVFDFFEKHAK